MRILFEDCDVDKAEDRTLPNNAFVVEYKVDNVSKYDIAAARSSLKSLIITMTNSRKILSL